MMIPAQHLPSQLKRYDYRFYLCHNKIPLEKQYNSVNNYRFFDERLLRHRGNIGICTGYGQLIVLDFDDESYYQQLRTMLPITFTVLSAGRRLPHAYYTLQGEMIRKTAILEPGTQRSLCDIQANRAGIICPGSVIDNKPYLVVEDIPITTLTYEQLESVFKRSFKRPRETHVLRESTSTTDITQQSVEYQFAHMIFTHVFKWKLTTPHHYKCPFHDMGGKGNLSILPSGAIYCFHEAKVWRTVFEFVSDLATQRTIPPTVRVLQNEYNQYLVRKCTQPSRQTQTSHTITKDTGDDGSLKQLANYGVFPAR